MDSCTQDKTMDLEEENSSKSGASSEDEEEEEDVSEDEADDKLNLMRKELSEVPFEDLQKLQDRVGLKVYDKALFGEQRSENSASLGPGAGKKKFKRANKNRPQEISSKLPVSRRRNVVQVKQKVGRDPRFDDLSGKFNEAAFDSNYTFMKGVYSREKKEVKHELLKEKTEKRREELQRLLQRMDQKEKERRKKESEKVLRKERKKQEKELIKQGKKPFFLKKSEQKKMELAGRYQELKKSGKLSKHLVRKRKRNAAKDRLHMPAPHSQQT